MPLPRIYQPVALTDSSEISLDNWGISHVKALRLREKDLLILFNGEGKEYEGNITTLNNKTIRVQLFSEQKPATEPCLKIHLLQAMARGERMDYIIQKTTELGVTSITPLLSERCEVRLCAERLQKRQQHWQQIAISACEQARRVCVPNPFSAIANG
jgi:16S rRNA (uracil1498-N3)-methyltransferase